VLPALMQLNMSGARITSFAGMPALPALLHLDASYTRVDSLEGLPPLPALTRLDLSGTEIATLAGLPALPALESLGLSGTPIDSLAGIPDVKELKIGGTRVPSLDEVPGSVESLGLDWHHNEQPVISLSGIERLTNLRWLDLRRSGITDLEPLRRLDRMPTVRVDRPVLLKQLI
jgi:Leucine-rich repeat (LRR) protein